ncbi:calpain-2 catalytic subunit-like [Salarias fasciatus]|uniref:calpain-2 catalytic subunit-like n=1 Tax=Salarias fasciatus TaxID=181472 RepID=UPI001176E68E|nr:calpain-2 catalytic subunit-like [Salarias fasciatus]
MTSNCTGIINLRYQDGSEGSASNPAKYNNQDYVQLKDNHLRRRRPFVDYSFPPNDRSLGNIEIPSHVQVEWLRPSEILKAQNKSEEPVFCSKGASRFDFGQGSIGNCWFLAAIGSLTFQKTLMAQVVPMDQSFNNYAGIFHFRFWHFGKWVDVVIDDLLPTANKQLLFVHCKGGNEFWVPLLEKAYAKLCGTYADMNAGLPSEACKDFSGGVNMSYDLQQEHTSGHDEELWLRLTRATGCKSMICCGTPSKGGRIVNTVAHTGLVDAHAYTVTGVTEVTYYGSKVRLVRVMNPWGKQEWTGKWNDKSDMWDRVNPEDREKCFNREDGEFWMELEDFCRYFDLLSMCCENPNFIDGDLTCQWKCMTYDGSWVAGRSSGGNVNSSSFYTNPQYRVQVDIIDRQEKDDQNIMISLMQKPQQENRKDRRLFATGLTIYKIPAGTRQGRLRSSFFRKNRPLNAQVYSYTRDLVQLYSLQPGEYVIIPSTSGTNNTADFVMSVYTKAEAKITPHHGDEDDHDHEHEEEEEEAKEEEEDADLILPEIPDKDKDDSNDRDPIRAIFRRYCDQRDELRPRQLQRLLADKFPHGTRNGFTLETCRSMIAIVDLDQRMTMTFKEFSILWKKITEYKKIFHSSDLNRGGTLSQYELQKAVTAAGMDVTDGMVMLMMFRYSGFSTTSLEEFIILMLHLDKTTSVFKDKSTDGVIHLTWEEWSNFSLYN